MLVANLSAVKFFFHNEIPNKILLRHISNFLSFNEIRL